MDVSLQDKDFDSAVNIVNAELKRYLLNIPLSIKKDTFEIRLRAGMPLILYGKYGSVFLRSSSRISYNYEDSIRVSPEMLSDTFNRLCCYSVHTYLPSLLNGFVTVPGGHRVGIASTAVTDPQGELTSVKNVSSLNIRISREFKGCGEEIFEDVYGETLKSIIIAGPPACGKTTILRDLIRILSDGKNGRLNKVCVVDERREIAAMQENIISYDLGYNCDVLSGFPKSRAITNLIKTMSPDVIALDEVSTMQEISAIAQGVNSGVKFIVTVHASDYDEIINRPQIRALINTYSFDKLILLGNPGNLQRVKAVYDIKELKDEIGRRNISVAEHSFIGCESIA